MIKLGIGLNSSEGFAAVKEIDRYKHLLCLGSTGMGKTTFLANLILEELEHACIILDPNGHLTENVAPHVPHERLIYIDKQHYLSLNPLTRGYLNWSENAKELIQLINAAVGEISPKQAALTVLMTRITKNALRVFNPEQLTIEFLMHFLDSREERRNSQTTLIGVILMTGETMNKLKVPRGSVHVFLCTMMIYQYVRF